MVRNPAGAPSSAGYGSPAPLTIRASGAAFTYAGRSHPAFSKLDIDVAPGTVLLIVGPSGSGKSTIARAIAGLLPSHFPGEWQGRLEVGDVDVAAPEANSGSQSGLAGAVGIVFQDPGSQLVMERVADDVAFGLENRAWPLAAMRERVPQALDALGLVGYEDRRSTRLSGGEQQRVAIAGGIAPRPGVLVLDEPTANLDPAGAAAVFDRIGAFRTARAATVVLVEHRADRAWPLADQVLALGVDGQPIDVGPAPEVLARSRDALTAAGVWLPEEPETRRRTPRGRRRVAARVHASDVVLDLERVRFGYVPEVPVLRDVSLALGPGSRVALTGPNGSGKTTLLRIATGLLQPAAGEVTLDGRPPARLGRRDIAALVGYVVQDPELGFIADTVEEEVLTGLEFDAAAAIHGRELAARLGLPLEAFGARSPYRLSGGEQRRLSLVTALARRPQLLVLDEPTFGQDRRGYEALIAALDELVDAGTAILAATHDERFVRDATDRRVELADGWIVSDEPTGRRAAS